MDWIKRDEHAMMSTYRRLPIVIKEGQGSYLIDETNKRYLDLITGLAVNIVGHSHPEIIKTIQEQATKFLHISNLYINKPAVELAEKLSERTIGGKVFYTNSGAEATEAVIKFVHKWSKAIHFEKKGVVVLKNSFHGRTLGALKLTRQKGVYQDFPLHDMPVYEVDPENIEALKQIIHDRRPAALLMEPVLGSGGIVPLTSSYLQEISSICKEHQMLLCMDEIQTGMGRTGSLFAYMEAQIEPDIVLFAKGVGGGLPLGGMIVKPELNQVFSPGDHGTTFAPSPLSSALGLTVLTLLDDHLLDQSRKVAERLHRLLQSLQETYSSMIDPFRGKGMMIGLPTKLTPEQTVLIQKKMLEKGVLVDVTQQTIIRLLPPLTLTEIEVDQFIDLFKETLEEVKQEMTH